MISFLILQLKFENEPNCFNTKIKTLIFYVFYTYIITIIFLIIGMLIFNLINFLLKTNINIFDLSKVTNSDLKSPVLWIVILGPILEEILFRFWLSFKSGEMLISLFFWIYYFVNGFTFFEYNLSKIQFILFLFTTLSLFLMFKAIKNKCKFTKPQKLNRYYWSSLVVFTLVHILNYENFSKNLLILVPFYLFPKFIIGFFITKLRVRFGFIWGLLFHIVINGISILLNYI